MERVIIEGMYKATYILTLIISYKLTMCVLLIYHSIPRIVLTIIFQTEINSILAVKWARPAVKPLAETSPKKFAGELMTALTPRDAQTRDDSVKIALRLTNFKILPKTVLINFGLMFLTDWLA